MSKEWPETVEEMNEAIQEVLGKFAGWDTYEFGNKKLGEKLYNESVDITVEATAIAFNYIAGKMGLSAYQASLVPSLLHQKLFGKFS